MTFHIPESMFFAGVGMIAVLAISNLLILKWFIGAAGILRAQKLEDRIKVTMGRAAEAFSNELQRAGAKFDETEDRILVLEKRLHESAQTFRNLTPPTVQAALDTKVQLAAEELTRTHRANALAKDSAAKTCHLWLKAALGGPSDAQKAAALGYPADLPNDLIILLDLFCDQRRLRVKGRNRGGNTPPMSGPVI